jgi:hypothetical protein
MRRLEIERVILRDCMGRLNWRVSPRWCRYDHELRGVRGVAVDLSDQTERSRFRVEQMLFIGFWSIGSHSWPVIHVHSHFMRALSRRVGSNASETSCIAIWGYTVDSLRKGRIHPFYVKLWKLTQSSQVTNACWGDRSWDITLRTFWCAQSLGLAITTWKRMSADSLMRISEWLVFRGPLAIRSSVITIELPLHTTSNHWCQESQSGWRTSRSNSLAEESQIHHLNFSSAI